MGSRLKNMGADQYIYNWCYMMVASMRGWITNWSEEMIDRNDGIILECNIFINDALLNL